jgi:hypothetical protein
VGFDFQSSKIIRFLAPVCQSHSSPSRTVSRGERLAGRLPVQSGPRMAKFLFLYRDDSEKYDTLTPEEMPQVYQKWQA